ncbi:MAG: PorT family protein [Bacteroidales bacterium]|nr:PorT family protein [Bacteroidales bacterium]
MKRALLLLIAFLMVSTISKSQILISLVFGDKLNSDKIEYGMDGGFNWSNISNLENSGLNMGLHLGFYFDIKMKENLFLHTGLILKSPMGAKRLESYTIGDPHLDSVLATATVIRDLRYFNVPILLKYRFLDQFYVEAGPQLGLLTKAYDNFSVDITDKSDVAFKNNVTDQYKRIDAGITVGLGYRLYKGHGVNLGVRYYYGMVDILKDNSESKQLNSSIYICAGIPIGVGKEEKKANAN